MHGASCVCGFRRGKKGEADRYEVTVRVPLFLSSPCFCLLVLRSLSKLYGMAGATASLKEKTLVPERRKALADIREDLCAWLDKKGYAFIPSEANMVLIDSKRPGRETAQAMLKQHKVAIGRSWEALPHHVRVTIGTRDEMARFKAAFERVMDS